MQHLIDPQNKIVQLCAEGMQEEGAGKPEAAKALFLQAWNEAANAFEKLIAAHYVARLQGSAPGKLEWDTQALNYAKEVSDEGIKGAFPSLYLNIAKGYEDMDDTQAAEDNYRLALSFVPFLQDDGYGKMILSGIEAGLKRVQLKS
jgi:hypothetical protein